MTDIFSALPSVAGSFDECRDGGAPREHWRTLAGYLDDIGDDGLALRSAEAARLLRENGVTYQLHGAPADASERPWRPDPLPLLIDPGTWARISDGVAQRARMLEAVLADAYGQQRLLGPVLHPASVLAHPGYLRPLHAVPVARRLATYACDLVRGPDGAWRVVADRAQAPAGMGYALETRIATSRALPEAYRSSRVHRLAPFFIARRAALAALAPNHRDNPRIVLLTPGTGSSTYFEHAWLARYLGFTLVEGADLAVRDECVFLKTLGGLHRVDVIVRRLDDDWCDPLELRDDSLLGIPGLVGAVRSGNVAVANALGSGLAENGAWLPAGDQLCRAVLGEEPVLPTVQTWWGAGLLPHLDRLLIRPAFNLRSEPIAGWLLSDSQRSELAARIADDPLAWIGQEIPPASTVPVWTAEGIAARHCGLRVFASVGPDGAVSVMPGGLTCVGEDPRLVAAIAPGGGSKDCWVLAGGPVPEVSLLQPASAPLVLKRGGADLPSRVADNFYWFGRYAERVECLCRLLRPCLGRLSDEPGSHGGQELAVLAAVIEKLGLRSDRSEPLERRILHLASGPSVVGGLHDGVRRMRGCAAALRDRMSNDTWRAVHHVVAELPAGDGGVAALSTALDRLVIAGAALAGMAAEGTTRGPGWRFLDLGRRLERAAFTLDLLRATVAGPHGDRSLEAVLDVADSTITYRSRYLTSLQAGAVVDLLLTDPTNPRAVAFLVQQVEQHVRKLPKDKSQALPTQPERLALGATTWLKLVDPHDLCRRDEDGGRSQLVHVLDHLASDLELLSDAVTTSYLTHATTGRSQMPGWARG
jgi:uncharacterized circularly permuted ATP-grasp superfamily protein/uncharacterized alpha-E superfamily protein